MAFSPPFSLPLTVGPQASKEGLDAEVNRVAMQLQDDRIAGDLALQSQIAVVLAQAEAIYGPLYDDTDAGLAATEVGEWFSVDNGDGTVTMWLHDTGDVATNPRTLPTTEYLASTSGASVIGMANGDTVQDAIDNIEQPKGIPRTVESFGAVGYTNFADALAGVDSTAAIQSALDYSSNAEGISPVIGAHFYKCGPVEVPSGATMIGMGRQSSGFVAPSGTSGKWWTDNGSASKLMLSGFVFYGNNEPGITHILDFGNNGVQFGTEGILSDLWVRNAPNAVAFDVNGNVGIIENISTQDTDVGVKIRGNANKLSNIVCMQSKSIGADLAGCNVIGLEVEAPDSGAIPVKMIGDVRIKNPVISIAAGTSFDALFEVDAIGYTDWQIEGATIYGTGAVTGGMVKVGSTYWGGTNNNAFTGLSSVKVTNFREGFELKGQLKQGFMIRVARNAGAIQHRIGGNLDSSAAGAWYGKINGASTALINTPTGTDASTAFANGAKISSGTPSLLVLDTPDQITEDMIASVNVVDTTLATDYKIRPVTFSTNINGVTRNRFAMQLFPPTGSASPVNWATAFDSDGLLIDIQVEAYLA